MVGGVATSIRNARLRRPTTAATSIATTSASPLKLTTATHGGPTMSKSGLDPRSGLNPLAERHQHQRAEDQPARATRRKRAIKQHIESRGGHPGHGAAADREKLLESDRENSPPLMSVLR